MSEESLRLDIYTHIYCRKRCINSNFGFTGENSKIVLKALWGNTLAYLGIFEVPERLKKQYAYRLFFYTTERL